jgi:hypothetical protein
MTLKRIALVVVGIWLLLSVASFVLWNLGGTTPPSRGQGDPVELSTP